MVDEIMWRFPIATIKESLNSHKKTIIGSSIATLIGVSVATFDDVNKTVRSTKNALDSFKEKQLSENIYVGNKLGALKETLNHYINHNDNLWSKQFEANQEIMGNVKREAGFEAGEDKRITEDEAIQEEIVSHDLNSNNEATNKNNSN